MTCSVYVTHEHARVCTRQVVVIRVTKDIQTSPYIALPVNEQSPCQNNPHVCARARACVRVYCVRMCTCVCFVSVRARVRVFCLLRVFACVRIRVCMSACVRACVCTTRRCPPAGVLTCHVTSLVTWRTLPTVGYPDI